MIKSIQVRTKPFDFKVGETYWVNHIFDTMEVVIVDLNANDPGDDYDIYKVHVVAAGDQDYYIGKDINIFPSDLGVPGHEYDRRPCGLFRSKLAADAATGRYLKWLDRRHNPISKYIRYK